MQGRGKDAADHPDGASSGMTGIGDGSGGTGATGIALEGPGQSREADEPEIRLDEAAQALIGQHLKAVYSEIVQQPVPDEFLKLLDDLERKERS